MTASREEAFFSWIALLFAAVVFLTIPLHGKVLFSELFAPFMLYRIWRQRKSLMRPEFIPLGIAFCWMILATIVHILNGSGGIYDLAVFLYMGVIFAFYSCTELPKGKWCAITGGCLLALTVIALLATKFFNIDGTFMEGFLYHDIHFARLEDNALVTRFQFLSSNPNLLGGAYVIPTLILLPALTDALKSSSWKVLACACLLTIIGILPLFATASKMSVMTFGLLAGAFASIPFLQPTKPRFWMSSAVIAFGLLCVITVLFRTYPALQKPPYVDFSHRGNYSVHQQIYGKILLDNGIGGALFGHSATELHELYPKYADVQEITEILEPYGFAPEAQLYCEFMDPHNEYLNTISFFGVPALLALVAFMITMICHAFRKNELSMALLVIGALFCGFWEDAASKRFIWIALGIAASRLFPRDNLTASN